MPGARSVWRGAWTWSVARACGRDVPGAAVVYSDARQWGNVVVHCQSCMRKGVLQAAAPCHLQVGVSGQVRGAGSLSMCHQIQKRRAVGITCMDLNVRRVVQVCTAQAQQPDTCTACEAWPPWIGHSRAPLHRLHSKQSVPTAELLYARPCSCCCCSCCCWAPCLCWSASLACSNS